MFGWIIPAPLAIPRRCTTPPASGTSTPIVFWRVSVVMIARATSPHPAWRGSISRTALAMRSIGSGTPMTPVLATATSCGSQPIFSAVA